MKKFYVVGEVCMNRDIAISGITVGKVKMSWFDGQCGVMPVFTNKKKAQKCAGKNRPIYTFNKVTYESITGKRVEIKE